MDQNQLIKQLNLCNKDCLKCPLSELRPTQVVNGIGPLDSKIMIIGEAPGSEEDVKGEPFVGRAGQKLNSMLTRVGVHRTQIRITNACRCFPKLRTIEGFRAPSYEEIETCLPYLEEEIKVVKPNVIVPVGNVALQAILGTKKAKIGEYRGKEIWSDKFQCKVIPTYHPSAVMRTSSLEEVVVSDFKRILESSKYPEMTPVEKGNYIVLDSIEKFDAFCERIMEQEEVAVDLETTGFDWQNDKIICASFSWKSNTGVLLPITKWIGIGHEKIVLKDKKVRRKGQTEIKQVETVEKWIEDTYQPWWRDKQEYVMSKFRQIMESDINFIGQNCLYAGTKVQLADGSSEYISNIVQQKQKVDVLSYNEKTGQIEAKPIINWFNKRTKNNVNKWLKIVTAKYDKFDYSYKVGPVVTDDHKIYIKSKGWVIAKDLKCNDIILSNEPKLNNTQLQVILGSILGDGTIARSSVTANFHFKVSHGDRQKDYIDFKQKLLQNVTKHDLYNISNFRGFNKRKNARIYTAQTIPLYQLEEIGALCLKNGKKVVTREYLDKLDLLGIAIWFMDDGDNHLNFATGSFSHDECQIICTYFKEKWDLDCGIIDHLVKYGDKVKTYYYITVLPSRESRSRFIELISPYILPSLRYKLFHKTRTQIESGNIGTKNNRFSRARKPYNESLFELPMQYFPTEIPIISIDSYKPRIRQNIRFCIEVADNHNFFACGMLVKNCKFDYKFFLQMGWNPKPLAYDTLLMHYLLNETAKGSHNLEDMSLQYLGKGQHKKELDDWFKSNKMGDDEKKNYARVPIDLLFSYGAADADMTFQLKQAFLPRLEEEGMLDLFYKLVMPLNNTLTHMEFEGFKIDKQALNKAKEELQNQLVEKEKEIKSIVGDIDLDSPKQLAKLFYEDLKLPIVKQTKKGAASTDEEAMNLLAEKHPVPMKIVEYRGIAKLLRTYVIGVEERLDDNNRLHTKFHQEGTESGRLSSRDVNFQNFPRDAKIIKNMFVVDKDNVLIEADEGQNEFRWWGIYSNDPQLVRDLNDGVDIHKLVASLANKIPIEQVTKEQRQKAKSIVFGLMFNMGADKLSKNHNVTIEYAEEVKSIFFSRYPTAKQWKYEIVKFARKNMYVQSRFGRVRHLLAINNPDEKIAYMDEQAAVNSPIQGSASDYVSNAANRIFLKLKELGLHGKLRNLIHDAIYVEAPKTELKQTLQIIKEEMERKILGIQVPLIAEFKIGKRWSRMHKIEVANNTQKQVAN